MFGSNPMKTGMNSSQYDFKGVAVTISIIYRLNHHLVHISLLHQGLVEMELPLVDLYQPEA